MSLEMELAQAEFLSRGGVLQRALTQKMKSGEIPKPGESVFREYPKEVRVSHGFEDVECETEVGNGSRKISWTENREIIERIIVNSEEEEERLLAGGKTDQAMEADRQILIARARSLGITVDLGWSMTRLRREMGEKLDAPEPVDKMAALESELAQLRKMAEMQAEIERLRAQLAPKAADDVDAMRAELVDLGVTPDKRWGAARLREELEKATDPDREAA